ncbi:response regulator [Candidatus Woesearchaeota archaeon]|nr:response regulator [Candidatus Woesearchaeota archaeon]
MKQKKTLNILLVDDTPEILVPTKIIIRHVLKELGHYDVNIDTAENGAAGLEKISHGSNGSYCLIISDYQMPVMDGLEFYKRLEPEQQRKVIFRTATPQNLEAELSKLEEPHYKAPAVMSKASPDIIDDFKQLFLKYLS